MFGLAVVSEVGDIAPWPHPKEQSAVQWVPGGVEALGGVCSAMRSVRQVPHAVGAGSRANADADSVEDSRTRPRKWQPSGCGIGPLWRRSTSWTVLHSRTKNGFCRAGAPPSGSFRLDAWLALLRRPATLAGCTRANRGQCVAVHMNTCGMRMS